MILYKNTNNGGSRRPCMVRESAEPGIEFAQKVINSSEECFLKKDTQHNLDLRGTMIPFSLLKASQIFKMINPGEVLEVLCSDPEVHEDLFKVLPAASYDLISMEALGDDQTSYRLRMVKKQSKSHN